MIRHEMMFINPNGVEVVCYFDTPDDMKMSIRDVEHFIEDAVMDSRCVKCEQRCCTLETCENGMFTSEDEVSNSTNPTLCHLRDAGYNVEDCPPAT